MLAHCGNTSHIRIASLDGVADATGGIYAELGAHVAFNIEDRTGHIQ